MYGYSTQCTNRENSEKNDQNKHKHWVDTVTKCVDENGASDSYKK
jgi:hypothetical protein